MVSVLSGIKQTNVTYMVVNPNCQELLGASRQ